MRSLAQVTEEQAAEKRAQARAVRDAFVIRGAPDAAESTATDFVLDEICSLARRYAARGTRASAGEVSEEETTKRCFASACDARS